MSLQHALLKYAHPLPAILEDMSTLHFVKGKPTSSAHDAEALKALFPRSFGQPLVTATRGQRRSFKPLRVGVVFSGGQAAGGHNVIAGLFDALKLQHPASRLFGFLGGPGGIVSHTYQELTLGIIDAYRNQGGFDLIGSGRTKIETDEQLRESLKSMQELTLDGLVVIGGDDSNTNAAILAEYFLAHQCSTQVIGVPKTIDGDLRNAHIPISFGFDTACKVYAEMIGNIARDCLSAKKYTHFIKLMGRSASHIALECALKTCPNLTLIGEEVAAKKQTLSDLGKMIADVVCQRAEKGKNYGIVLVPEGLIEFIPEVKMLIEELNRLPSLDQEQAKSKLTPPALACFEALPFSIQKQLLLDRDPHGNVQVSLIETEQLLIELTRKELKLRHSQGLFKGKFSPLHHFFGYEGRAAFPSHFDAAYCTTLGYTAAMLLAGGFTGYVCAVQHLHQECSAWTLAGVPITLLMNLEVRHGKSKPVIQKALVDLHGKSFAKLQAHREQWAVEDAYLFPGPIQFFGPTELTQAPPLIISV